MSGLIYGTRDGLAFYLPPDYAQTLTVANDPNVDLVNSSLTSKQLRDALLAAAPVSDDALAAACLRDPPMTKNDLASVLAVHPTLSDPVLLAVIASGSFGSGDVTNTLIKNSPLSPEVLQAALDRVPALSLSDLSNLLSKQ